MDNHFIKVPEIALNDLFDKVFGNVSEFFFQAERLEIIQLYILVSDQYVSNFDLQYLLKMSKNSILNDIKKIREDLSLKGFKLNYTRQRGYFIEANFNHFILLLEDLISRLLAYPSGKWIIKYVLETDETKIYIDEMLSVIYRIGKTHQIYFIRDKVKEVAYLFAILNTVNKCQFSESIVSNDISDSYIEPLVSELMILFPNLRNYQSIITSRLLCSIQGDINRNYNLHIYRLMETVTANMIAYTGFDVQNKPIFYQNLYSHFYSAYHRILFGITYNNPLKEKIMEEYKSLFYLVQKSLEPIEIATNTKINDDEIAYFTVHFGGYLENVNKHEEKPIRALTVCPNGISSSLILQSNLNQLFPEMTFLEIHEIGKIKELDLDSYDLIFSTSYFETLKPFYKVEIVMNPLEKLLLKRRIATDFGIHDDSCIQINKLLAIIEKNTTIRHKERLIDELSTYLVSPNDLINKGGNGLMDLLKSELILQVDSVKDWKEAIRLASTPLQKNGYISDTYVEAMIDSVKEHGSYIVLAPGVAVPHALPKFGVHKLGISLLQLKEPVDFDIEKDGDLDKQVRLIFVLAAIDSTAHLKALQELAVVLEDETIISDIANATDQSQILTIINTKLKMEEEK